MGGCSAEASGIRSKKKVMSAHLLEGPPETDGDAKAKAERREAKAARDRQKKRVGIDSVPQLDSTRLAQESDPFRDGNGEFPVGECLPIPVPNT